MSTRFLEALLICGDKYKTPDLEDSIIWALNKIIRENLVSPDYLLLIYLMSLGMTLKEISDHTETRLTSIIFKIRRVTEILQFLVGGILYDEYLAKLICIHYKDEYSDKCIEFITDRLKRGILTNRCREEAHEEIKMYTQAYI